MKLLKIVLLLLFLSGKSYGQYTVPPFGEDWLMPFCTVDFVDGEILYRFPNDASFVRIEPHYYAKEYYQIRAVPVLRIWENKHRYDVDLDVFVETFDVIRNNSTEKDRFIRERFA